MNRRDGLLKRGGRADDTLVLNLPAGPDIVKLMRQPVHVGCDPTVDVLAKIDAAGANVRQQLLESDQLLERLMAAVIYDDVQRRNPLAEVTPKSPIGLITDARQGRGRPVDDGRLSSEGGLLALREIQPRIKLGDRLRAQRYARQQTIELEHRVGATCQRRCRGHKPAAIISMRNPMIAAKQRTTFSGSTKRSIIRTGCVRSGGRHASPPSEILDADIAALGAGWRGCRPRPAGKKTPRVGSLERSQRSPRGIKSKAQVWT